MLNSASNLLASTVILTSTEPLAGTVISFPWIVSKVFVFKANFPFSVSSVPKTVLYFKVFASFPIFTTFKLISNLLSISFNQVFGLLLLSST